MYDNPEYAGVIEVLKKQLGARRTELGEDDPKFAHNRVIKDFWDYGPEESARAIEISHRYRIEKKEKE